jgi:UDP-glucose 4-epimerase
VRQALRDEEITVYGDGSQSRCFCDVRDVAQAIIGLAQHPTAAGNVYNVGGAEEVTIRQLAERIKRLTGSSSPLVTIPYSEAYAPGFEDMQRRVPDTTRIKDLLGWQPRRSLDEILQGVIAYERERP